MKILQVCPRYYPHIGGVEEHVRNISERLVKRHEVTVATTDPSGKLQKEEVINRVKVKRFESWAPNEAYYFSRELKKYLVKNSDSYDVVHAHSYHAFPAFYAAKAKNANKLIFTPHYHGTSHSLLRSLLHFPYKFLGKKIFEKADKIICVSNYERKLVIKRFNINANKVVVIPNGVNLDEFKGLKRRKKNCRVILSVGRLEKYKGMQCLIKALPKLDQDIILEIVGKGPYKSELIRLAKKLNVENRIRFFQDLPRTELLRKYADADIFVLLSRYEAYAMVVAEALCAKLPCIVTDNSALSEWVDSENCFGIDDPTNSDKLASLIKKVIGRKVKGVEIPDWDDVTDQLLHLYEGIVYSSKTGVVNVHEHPIS